MDAEKKLAVDIRNRLWPLLETGLEATHPEIYAELESICEELKDVYWKGTIPPLMVSNQPFVREAPPCCGG